MKKWPEFTGFWKIKNKKFQVFILCSYR
jgi:hypothetical protein